MGNVESAASAAKATMQMNKFMDGVGKEFNDLTKSGKKEGTSDSVGGKKPSAGEDSGVKLNFFEPQRRQSKMSHE